MTGSFTVCSNPGPAFIPFNVRLWGKPKDDVKSGIILRAHGVPKDYVFQPATDHTMAGWVWRKGSQPLAEGGAVGRSALAER